jgi:hypothetical protein
VRGYPQDQGLRTAVDEIRLVKFACRAATKTNSVCGHTEVTTYQNADYVIADLVAQHVEYGPLLEVFQHLAFERPEFVTDGLMRVSAPMLVEAVLPPVPIKDLGVS